MDSGVQGFTLVSHAWAPRTTATTTSVNAAPVWRYGAICIALHRICISVFSPIWTEFPLDYLEAHILCSPFLAHLGFCHGLLYLYLRVCEAQLFQMGVRAVSLYGQGYGGVNLGGSQSALDPQSLGCFGQPTSPKSLTTLVAHKRLVLTILDSNRCPSYCSKIDNCRHCFIWIFWYYIPVFPEPNLRPGDDVSDMDCSSIDADLEGPTHRVLTPCCWRKIQ